MFVYRFLFENICFHVFAKNVKKCSCWVTWYLQGLFYKKPLCQYLHSDSTTWHHRKWLRTVESLTPCRHLILSPCFGCPGKHGVEFHCGFSWHCPNGCDGLLLTRLLVCDLLHRDACSVFPPFLTAFSQLPVCPRHKLVFSICLVFWLAFCCDDKHHGQNQLGEERICFVLQVIASRWEKPGQELKAGTWSRCHGGMLLTSSPVDGWYHPQ